MICKCKYCGQDFLQNTRGKKREYCRKEECLRKAKNETQKKWYANKMSVLKGTKNRIVEPNKKRIIYSSTDKAINSVKNEDFSDIISLARELGAIRFRIIEEIKKCSPEQSRYDKEDQLFLHKIENLAKQDEIYADDVIQVVQEHIDKRQNRRFLKDKQEMLNHLIQGCISNPSAYVSDFIKKRDNREYKPNIIEKKVGGNN